MPVLGGVVVGVVCFPVALESPHATTPIASAAIQSSANANRRKALPPTQPPCFCIMRVSSLPRSQLGAYQAANTVYRAEARASDRGRQLEAFSDGARRLGWRKLRRIDRKAL